MGYYTRWVVVVGYNVDRIGWDGTFERGGS